MTRRTAFLMPIYNPAPEKLALTLDSLMNQSEPADIVIVDDGSRQPIAGMLQPRDNLKILRLDRNQGITAALNSGLAHIIDAGYEYVARMDCGDVCDSRRVELQERHMDRNPDCDLLGAFADIVNEQGQHLFYEGTAGGHEAIGRKLRDNAAFKHPTFFIRTSFVEKFGDYSPDYAYAEDYEFLWRAFANGRVDCLEDVLIVYEKNAAGLSHRNRRAQLTSRLRIQLRYFDPARYRSYIGALRTIIALLIPARAWSQVSSLYWVRQNKRHFATQLR
jgi:glycosyltransferase involved in cell wall biosynthesis